MGFCYLANSVCAVNKRRTFLASVKENKNDTYRSFASIAFHFVTKNFDFDTFNSFEVSYV